MKNVAMTSVSRCSRRRGFSGLYLVMTLAAICGFVSFGIDYGRVQLAKTELRRASDAAARAGCAGMGNYVTAQNLAVQYAGLNSVDGNPLVLNTATDIQFGTWNSTTRTFTALSQANWNSATAIQITARRSSATGNAVPLTFGSVVGIQSCDISTTSVATISGGYGLVGINSISFKGNSSASYWSSTGTTGGNSGNIASNGAITSSGSSTVYGTVWHQSGQTLSGVTSNQVKTLSTPLSYPNANCTPYMSNYVGDENITSNLSVPAGTYVVNNLTIGSNATVTFSGPTTIYYFGTCSITGHTLTSSNTPGNLTIIGCPNPNTGAAPGSLTIGGSSALYANIYCPQNAVVLSGSGAIYGSVLGSTVSMTGTSNIYYDLSSLGGGGISLVK